MNILMIGPFPDPVTGQSIANLTVKNAFIKNGHSVEIIDTKSTKIGDMSSQGRLVTATLLKALVQQFQVILYLYRSNGCKVYITPGQTLLGFLRYAPSILAANIFKYNVVLHFHGAYFGKMYEKASVFTQYLLRIFLARVNRIIVLGPSLKYMFKQSEGIESKTICCANGIPNNLILSGQELRDKHTKHDPSMIKIIYLSNLIESKGVLDLINAVRHLDESGYSVSLDICGYLDQSIKDRFHGCFKSIEHICAYHGVVHGEKKKNLLAKNEIFCLPTYYPVEGQPISILEAYGQGCAVVTTDQGGIRDVFKDFENGKYCLPRDYKSIANAILVCQNRFLKISENNSKLSKYRFREEDFIGRVSEIID